MVLKSCMLTSYKDKEGHREAMSAHLSFVKMTSVELIELSSDVFDELLKRFENIYALLRCPVDGVGTHNSEAQFSKDEFVVLLRNCLMMLQFLEFDTSLLWEKCGVLFKILGRVFPSSTVDSHEFSIVSTGNLFSKCCSYSSGGINEEFSQLLNFFSLILEVFIAEFSENVALSKHLILFYVLTHSEKLHSCRNTHTDGCAVMELVSSHFLLSVKNGLAFNRFLHLLSGSSEFGKMTPAISVHSSLKLISTPFILSAPYIIQAHLILLASRCISSHLAIDSRNSDTPVGRLCINPFELSVNLYLSYLSTMQPDDAILEANVRSNLGIVKPLSNPIVHRMTWGEHTHQANDLGDFSHLHSKGVLSGTKSEVLAYSAAYIHGNHPLIDQLCKEASCLAVEYIIENILPRKLWEQKHNENKERLPNEVYCLVAAMNLMNSSLLHITCHSTQSGFYDEMKMSRDCPFCITYECLSQSASILRVSGCAAEQRVQKFIYDMFGAYGGMHLEIKFMLAHISSLLVFSFRRKLDFFWKGCISMMMTLMNLLLLEERKLGLSKIFNLLQSPPGMNYKGLNCRTTSVMIAANVEKTRMLYLKNEIQYGHANENGTGASERRVEVQQSGICSVEVIEERKVDETQGNACNAERFIACIPSFHANPLEWEDLADFIECSPEKDYFSWLNNRNKFKKWKKERQAVLKRQKRKRKVFGISKEYNLRARIHSGKSIEVKLQEQGSIISRMECIEDRVREIEGQVSSSGHADPSGLKDIVVPIEWRPAEEKQDCSELKDLTMERRPEAEKQVKPGLRKSRKKSTIVIVKQYNLRARVDGGKHIQLR